MYTKKSLEKRWELIHKLVQRWSAASKVNNSFWLVLLTWLNSLRLVEDTSWRRSSISCVKILGIVPSRVSRKFDPVESNAQTHTDQVLHKIYLSVNPTLQSSFASEFRCVGLKVSNICLAIERETLITLMKWSSSCRPRLLRIRTKVCCKLISLWIVHSGHRQDKKTTEPCEEKDQPFSLMKQLGW